MLRLYYVAEDLDTTCRVSEALHEEGIRDWNFHVLSRDEEGLYRHHVHSALTYHELDIVHTGVRFALTGAAIGFAIAFVSYLLQPLPWQITALEMTLFTLVGAFFGAWQGGMIGLSRENYKIAPFHDDIEAGRYLIMVDVRATNRGQVRELMNMQFPGVRAGGVDTTLINPLSRPVKLNPQTTH